MSHIVKIKTEVRDFDAVRYACNRLQLEQPIQGTFQLYSSRETGCGVQLRDWKYPVVCQLETGELKFDNYGGRWGQQNRLDEFLQAYGVEMTKLQARKKGFSVTEQALVDGSIKLTVAVGGAF